MLSCPWFNGEKLQTTPPTTSTSKNLPIVMMKSIAILTMLLGFSSAFSPMKIANVKTTTQLRESFGTGLGTDTYSSQDILIGGEANYKQWVNEVNQNNMLNRQVCTTKISDVCRIFYVMSRF
jgi:hypothetical protein